jgi:hypothetical protein
MQGKALVSKKFFIPVGLVLWLLVSLSFTLLIPRAEAYDPATGCPSNDDEAMEGVWSPSRLRIDTLCQQASGTVTFFEIWEDGDWNVYVQVDQTDLVNPRSIQNLRTWDQARQNGGANMLWEAIPRDQGSCGNPGALGPEPSVGDVLQVRGVHVWDKYWQWYELHPLVQITENGQTCTRSGPSSTESSGTEGADAKGPEDEAAEKGVNRGD